MAKETIKVNKGEPTNGYRFNTPERRRRSEANKAFYPEASMLCGNTPPPWWAKSKIKYKTARLSW
jgi:hypothetical protein